MIPIAKTFLGEKEIKAVKKVVLSGWITQGPKVKEFEDAFAAYVDSKFACAVSSCTSALHLALIVAGVKPGDIVITVSHSFIATANCIRHCGGEPVFVDIDRKTFNMSPRSLKKCLEEDFKIKHKKLFYKHVLKIAVGESPLIFMKNSRVGRLAAIMPVHQMGMPCDISSITSIAKKYNLPVIEDAACAIGSEVKIGNKWQRIGKPQGDIACFSFHPRKVITTGDGGMITTNNHEYDKKFRALRHHGMSVSDTARYLSKKVIFENYVISGYNYRMTDIQAAIGIEQLKKLPRIIDKRREINRFYRKYLSSIDWVQLPHEPGYIKNNWQSYPIRILENAPLARQEIMQYLLDNGISTRPGIMNAHSEDPYLDANYSLRHSEEARNNVILLPIFIGMSERNVRKIARLLKKLQER